MTRPFVPTRIVGGTVIAEREPFAFTATASYRGAEILDEEALPRGPARPLRARRVVVRAPHAHIANEAHFVELFQGSVAEVAMLAGTAAPQLLHVLGHDGVAHAIVEEHIAGAKLDAALATLRERGAQLPVEVALAIAAELVGLWRVPEERGQPVPIFLGTADVEVTAAGRVRARPELENDLARQIVGAAVGMFRGSVAYVSPEQLDGERSAASGMFTLGVLLSEMLLGAHPAAPASGEPEMMAILSRLRNADLPSVTTMRAVPADVAALVTRMTARAPSARFPTWAALAERLSMVRAGLPPVGPAELLRALPTPPVEPPALDLQGLAGWRGLPHDGLVPITLGVRSRAAAPTRVRSELAADFHYPPGTDGRPMLAHGTLLIDARPVSVAELARFALATRRSLPDTVDDDAPATRVSIADAEAYARWAGKRLPTDAEWVAAVVAIGADRLAAGEVWEWTATPVHGGRVVRGGRFRNTLDQPATPANQSYETGPAPDVGFRCVR